MDALPYYVGRIRKERRVQERSNKGGREPGTRQKPGEPPEGDYLTIQELATWLKISRGSAWSLVMERGEIPHSRFGDRVVRLARADVEAYLA